MAMNADQIRKKFNNNNKLNRIKFEHNIMLPLVVKKIKRYQRRKNLTPKKKKLKTKTLWYATKQSIQSNPLR